MNGFDSKNNTALTSSSIRAVISAMTALSAKCMRGANLSRLESPHSPFGRNAMLRMMVVAATCALVAAPAAAQTAQQLTYRCVGNDGKKYYSSTIPMQCAGRVVEQLNAHGLVIKRIDPEGEQKEREEKEAAA